MPTGSEDCLYLNVFSRAERVDAKLPVLIWIHGGAFNFGSGSGLLYGPERAMDQEIVLVTLRMSKIPITIPLAIVLIIDDICYNQTL